MRKQKLKEASLSTPAKGAYGEKNNNVKLRKGQVELIRWLYHKNGWTQASLAKRFGCSQRNISFIISFKTWV
jgi:antitoxin component HigA of HigAB toxin-antitoxin module